MRSLFRDIRGSGRRIVVGAINADGTIRMGQGEFTVSKTGTGTFVVALTPPFRVMPVVIGNATDVVGNQSRVVHTGADVTAVGWTFYVDNGSNLLIDVPFHFIAVEQGPSR